jgi:hypothetical protein
MKYRLHNILLASILLGSCLSGSAEKVYYAPGNENQQPLPEDTAQLLYTVYLIGDIKYPQPDNENLTLLKQHISEQDTLSAVVVLGDILYPLGLRDSSDRHFAKDEANLKYILNTFDSFKGEVVFLPGNHDWARGREDGWETVIREEEYIEQFLDRGNTFLPDGGCPGPVELELSPDITLIVINSQWWFQKHEKPGPDGACDFEDEEEIFIAIEDAIRRNRDKKIIFATHHPLYSAGKHGGYFPVSYLLFPLLEIKNWMYLPLPGFIYTGYRKYFGNIQDLAHPEYKIFKEKLTDLFKAYSNVIYAAGHEHNLQYFEKDSLNHIISGGGGEGTYIARKKKKTDFAYQSPGFSKLSFYSNGNAWMEFISPDGTPGGKVVYTRKLFNKPVFEPESKEINKASFDFSDSTITVRLTDMYKKGSFYTFMRGKNYRNIWQARVEIPVFDMGTERGGLSIIKRGGGQQTRSLRLEDKNGRQYVLRSVNKYVAKALPENFRNTVAVDVLQDGISASHPYAAVTLPQMAEAIGIMYTNPEFVWLPDDPRLGIYREGFANDVYLFEERPDGDRSDLKSFSRPEKIVSTHDVVKKTQKEPDHQVDQNAVVRARIFDILINDWDRHDDQWRWAGFKENGLTIYRPIPRDRDQVYFVNEGAAMWLVTKFYPLRKFHGFDKEIYDVKGLTYNARHFDRYFMTEPDLNDWLTITKDIQNKLTDTIIHQAIHTLPPNIYDLSGIEIENKLKARRDMLSKSITDYYRFLSKTVDVVGTNDQELFLVERLENGNTNVNIHELSKKKRKIKEQLYFREFKFNETKEIRLYGLKGEDTFKLHGSGKKGIKVRIIGGKGDDTIIDHSKVRGPGKKTIVYDRKDKGNVIVKSNETHLQLSKKKSINSYDRMQYKRNTIMPVVVAGYNVDDGIYIGGGVKLKRYNFRDSTEHNIKGNIAFQTGAFTVSYKGLFSALSKTFDLSVDAQVSIPKNVNNFFGLGNNSEKLTDDKSYYRVRYQYIWLNPMLQHTLSKRLDYSFGAFYQFFKVTDTINKFIGDAYPQYLDSTAYSSHNYTGINAKLKFDTRDDEMLPTRGVLWETQARGFYSINEDGNNFLKLLSDLSLYLSFNKDPRFVFALRLGGAVNIGDYEFYHANFLGGKTNLRGFRGNRFAGDQSFYLNAEVRFKLLDIKSYLFNGQTGILLFNDIGRVWVKGENSKTWHDGFGAGIWVTPFDFTVLTLTYNRSYEEDLIDFTFRFLF